MDNFRIRNVVYGVQVLAWVEHHRFVAPCWGLFGVRGLGPGRHKSSSHGCRSSHPGCAKAALAIQDLAWAEHHRFVLSMLCYIPSELAVFGIGGCESDDAYTETLNSAWCVLAYRVLAWRHIAVSPRLQERSPRMRESGIDDTGPGPGGAPTVSSDCKARSTSVVFTRRTGPGLGGTSPLCYHHTPHLSSSAATQVFDGRDSVAQLPF